MFRKLATIGLLSVLALLQFVPVVVAEEVDEIRFGIIPLENKTVMLEQFKPLAEYLTKETGIKVKLVVGKDYQGTIDLLGKGDVQIAYLTPTTYPKCEKQNPDAGIQPLVKFLKSGKGFYNSCLIVPADSTTSSPSELKGTKVAFGSTDSTSSHLMPRAMLIGAGVDIEKDVKDYKYLNSHSNVAKAVSMGHFDVGGVKISVAEEYANDGKVKILETSGDIPEFPVCINDELPEEVLNKIRTALMNLNDGGDAEVLKSINKKYTGVEAAGSEDYDVIREMITNLYGDEFYNKK